MPAARVRPALRPPVEPDLAAALAQPEQGFEEFGASRADQPGEAEDLPRPNAEARVLGEAFRAEMRDFERRRPGRRRRARRIEREQVAPHHQAGHVDRFQFGAGPRRHLLAVAQNRDDVGDRLHLLEAMGNVKDRDALGLQFANELEERRRLDRRQRGGRLVEDHDAVGDGQRAGDLRQLPLRDRQALDRHVHRRLDAEHAHRLGRAAVHLAVVDPKAPPRLPAEKHVLGDRQIGREHDLLMHEHDATALGVDRPLQFDGRAVELQDAAGRRQMAADDLHQGRLSGAVLADDRMDFARADIQRNVAQHLDRPERTRQADRFQNGRRRSRRGARSTGIGLRLDWLARLRHPLPSGDFAEADMPARPSPLRPIRKAPTCIGLEREEFEVEPRPALSLWEREAAEGRRVRVWAQPYFDRPHRPLGPDGPLPPGEGSGQRPQGEGSLAQPHFVRPRRLLGPDGLRACARPSDDSGPRRGSGSPLSRG